MKQHRGTIACTLCGTALGTAANVSPADLWHTALLAALGAAVSFTVSLALKHLARRWKL